MLHRPVVDTLTELLDEKDGRVRLGAVVLLHKVSRADPSAQRGKHRDVTVRLDPALVIRRRLEQMCAAHVAELHSLAPPSFSESLADDSGEIVDAELVADVDS